VVSSRVSVTNLWDPLVRLLFAPLAVVVDRSNVTVGLLPNLVYVPEGHEVTHPRCTSRTVSASVVSSIGHAAVAEGVTMGGP